MQNEGYTPKNPTIGRVYRLRDENTPLRVISEAYDAFTKQQLIILEDPQGIKYVMTSCDLYRRTLVTMPNGDVVAMKDVFSMDERRDSPRVPDYPGHTNDPRTYRPGQYRGY